MWGGWIVGALVLGSAGCGRLGFDDVAPAGDGGAGPDDSAAGDLVAWLTFDDPPGDGALDSSGNGHDGVCLDGCPGSIAGPVAGAYAFDAGALISLPASLAFALTDGFTVAAWVRFDQLDLPVTCPFGKSLDNVDRNPWQLCVRDDRRLLACVNHGAGNDCRTQTPEVALGTWTHLAMSYDGTRVRVFVGADERGGFDTTIADAEARILIGGDLDVGVPYGSLRGAIDDFRLWSRALAATELAALPGL
ncbi:MAG: LamG domain-containing protein [Kofleriaceae bacterium]